MFPDDIVDHLGDWPQIQAAVGQREPPSIQLVNSCFFLKKTGNVIFYGENHGKVGEKPKV
jgi:hypothetical protein